MPGLVQFRMNRCVDGYEIARIDGDAYELENPESVGKTEIVFAPGTPKAMRRLIKELGATSGEVNRDPDLHFLGSAQRHYLVPKSEATECYEPLER